VTDASFHKHIQNINTIRFSRVVYAPCIAAARVTEKIFVAVSVDWYHHVVLTQSFKLVSFLHMYLLFYCRR